MSKLDVLLGEARGGKKKGGTEGWGAYDWIDHWDKVARRVKRKGPKGGERIRALVVSDTVWSMLDYYGKLLKQYGVGILNDDTGGRLIMNRGSNSEFITFWVPKENVKAFVDALKRTRKASRIQYLDNKQWIRDNGLTFVKR